MLVGIKTSHSNRSVSRRSLDVYSPQTHLDETPARLKTPKYTVFRKTDREYSLDGCLFGCKTDLHGNRNYSEELWGRIEKEGAIKLNPEDSFDSPCNTGGVLDSLSYGARIEQRPQIGQGSRNKERSRNNQIQIIESVNEFQEEHEQLHNIIEEQLKESLKLSREKAPWLKVPSYTSLAVTENSSSSDSFPVDMGISSSAASVNISATEKAFSDSKIPTKKASFANAVTIDQVFTHSQAVYSEKFPQLDTVLSPPSQSARIGVPSIVETSRYHLDTVYAINAAPNPCKFTVKRKTDQDYTLEGAQYGPKSDLNGNSNYSSKIMEKIEMIEIADAIAEAAADDSFDESTNTSCYRDEILDATAFDLSCCSGKTQLLDRKIGEAADLLGGTLHRNDLNVLINSSSLVLEKQEFYSKLNLSRLLTGDSKVCIVSFGAIGSNTKVSDNSFSSSWKHDTFSHAWL